MSKRFIILHRPKFKHNTFLITVTILQNGDLPFGSQIIREKCEGTVSIFKPTTVKYGYGLVYCHD